MKKILTLLVLLVLYGQRSKAQVFNFTVTQPGCYAGSAVTISAAITSTAPGATSYSWVPFGPCTTSNVAGGLSTTFTAGCCGTYTLSCYAYNGSTQITSISHTVYVPCGASVSLSTLPGQAGCAGTTFTMSANGAQSYTWMPGLFVGSQAVVTPSASTCYTVIGTNSVGCTGSAVSCISLTPVNLTITGPNSACAGSQVTFNSSSASSYTWSNGSHGQALTLNPPAGVQTYTLAVTLGACGVQTAAITITVNAAPSLTVTQSPSSGCAGSVFSLTASGASGYTWSIGSTLASIVVSPTASTCYSVMGTNGCQAVAVSCVSITPASITVAGPATVCSGSSVTYTASAASSYSWSTGATTSTINVIPTSTLHTYTVSGVVNGCPASAVKSTSVLTNCVDVWPGDANSDGVVDNFDMLEIGLAFNATGASRSPGGNTFVSQRANSWSGTVSTGKNKAHADCDGNGTVASADTNAIYSNFTQTHSFRHSMGGAAGDISIVFPNTAPINGWVKGDIMLGSSTNNINNVLGVAFQVMYDPSMVDNNQVYVLYTPSFLNASTTNLKMAKADFANSVIYGATVRTDHNDVTGNGKIGEFYFMPKSTGTFSATVGSIKMIGSNGTTTMLNGSAAQVQVVAAAPDGLSEAQMNGLRIYPNPAVNTLRIDNVNGSAFGYSLTDVSGRVLITGKAEGTATLDVHALPAGIYFLNGSTGGRTITEKVVINR